MRGKKAQVATAGAYRTHRAAEKALRNLYSLELRRWEISGWVEELPARANLEM